jgi:hypothetical protein
MMNPSIPIAINVVKKKSCAFKFVPTTTNEFPRIDPIKKLVNTMPYINPFELLLLTETKNCEFKVFNVLPKKYIEIPNINKYMASALANKNATNPKMYIGVLNRNVFLCPNLSDSFPTHGMGRNCIIVPIDTIIPVITRDSVSSNKKGWYTTVKMPIPKP